MNKQELIVSLSEIYENMKRESSSKAFIQNSKVDIWADVIWSLTTQLNEFWIDSEENYEENGIQFCWSCNQKVSKLKKHIDKTMISGLIKAFDYVMKNQTQTFMISELPLNRVEYWVLNHLVRFGLLYKSSDMKRWEYGVSRRTVSKFMKWEWAVAKYFIQDPTKQEDQREMSEERIFISDIPSVANLREEFGDTLVSYEWNNDCE